MGSLRGVSIVAGVIFLALTISAAVIVYQAGVPAVRELQTTAAVNKMKVTLSDFDKVIREVASEGQGSKRTIFISSDPGILTINGSTDSIIWELETVAPIISPRTSQQFGNLVIGSNMKTSVTEGQYTRVSPAVDAFIMENSRLVVYVRREGSYSSPVTLTTNDLVLAIYNKDLQSWFENPGFIEISIDNNANSKTSQGYTEAILGERLPFGRVKAYMNTTYIDYNIYFNLESGADFLIIEAQEIV